MECRICEYQSVCFTPLKTWAKVGGVCKQGRVKRNTAKAKTVAKTSVKRVSKSAPVSSGVPASAQTIPTESTSTSSGN